MANKLFPRSVFLLMILLQPCPIEGLTPQQKYWLEKTFYTNHALCNCFFIAGMAVSGIYCTINTIEKMKTAYTCFQLYSSCNQTPAFFKDYLAATWSTQKKLDTCAKKSDKTSQNHSNISMDKIFDYRRATEYLVTYAECIQRLKSGDTQITLPTTLKEIMNTDQKCFKEIKEEQKDIESLSVENAEEALVNSWRRWHQMFKDCRERRLKKRRTPLDWLVNPIICFSQDYLVCYPFTYSLSVGIVYFFLRRLMNSGLIMTINCLNSGAN